MTNLNVSAVYAICHRESGKQYIGQSLSVVTRWGNHRALLQSGHHPEPPLQMDWNVHGIDAFEVIILEEVEMPASAVEMFPYQAKNELRHELRTRERYWFGKRLAERGSWEYNWSESEEGKLVTRERRIEGIARSNAERWQRECDLHADAFNWLVLQIILQKHCAVRLNIKEMRRTLGSMRWFGAV